MLNSAWKKARIRADLPNVRVHTFGRRLRAAGISFEDPQDLLGHKSSRITTHYSSTELGNLMEAANRVCTTHEKSSPALTILRTATSDSSRKNPARRFEAVKENGVSY